MKRRFAQQLNLSFLWTNHVSSLFPREVQLLQWGIDRSPKLHCAWRSDHYLLPEYRVLLKLDFVNQANNNEIKSKIQLTKTIVLRKLFNAKSVRFASKRERFHSSNSSITFTIIATSVLARWLVSGLGLFYFETLIDRFSATAIVLR